MAYMFRVGLTRAAGDDFPAWRIVAHIDAISRAELEDS